MKLLHYYIYYLYYITTPSPKVFVSELRISELPPAAARIVDSNVGDFYARSDDLLRAALGSEAIEYAVWSHAPKGGFGGGATRATGPVPGRLASIHLTSIGHLFGHSFGHLFTSLLRRRRCCSCSPPLYFTPSPLTPPPLFNKFNFSNWFTPWFTWPHPLPVLQAPAAALSPLLSLAPMHVAWER